MKSLKHIILLIGIYACSVSVYAQKDGTPEMVTDRPDQSESSMVLPKGFLQAETGFIHEKTSELVDNTNYHSTLLRYGLLDNLELRLGNEYLRSSRELAQGDTTVQGLTPLTLGTKIFISEENGIIPELAFLAGVALPYIGREEFTPNHIAPSMRIAATHTISDLFSLGWNFGGEWSGENSETSGFYSGVLGIGVTDKIGAYVELYGFLPEDHKPDHRFDAGLTYQVRGNLQLDLSGGLGVNEMAPDGFYSFGISYRMPN
ncbi:MAG: transporter [Bacteroidales bacterium]|nr:transporter [Bacteroidales bacterium]